jgi:hypothetical protein
MNRHRNPMDRRKSVLPQSFFPGSLNKQRSGGDFRRSRLMRLRFPFRILGLAFAGALLTTPLSAQVPEFFDGGGSGPTPEVAVQAAIDDARNTASGYGLFTCELAGEPQVFPRPPGSHRAFAAQVRMRCTP